VGAGGRRAAQAGVVRSVREENAAKDALDDACVRWTRADDAWQAITWAIVHDVNVGSPIGESGVTRALELDGARSNDTPTVWVLYGIQPTLVTVYEARFTEAALWQIGRA